MYGWFEDVNFMYLVLEKCCNGDLHHFLKRRGNPLPESEGKSCGGKMWEGKCRVVQDDLHFKSL